MVESNADERVAEALLALANPPAEGNLRVLRQGEIVTIASITTGACRNPAGRSCSPWSPPSSRSSKRSGF